MATTSTTSRATPASAPATSGMVASSTSPIASSSQPSVRFDRLTADNYLVWSMRMKALLRQMKLWSAIEPSAGAVVHDDVDVSAHMLILQCVDDEHLGMLESANVANASGAWEKLKAMHASVSRAKQMQLRRELLSISQDHGESVMSFSVRIRSASDRLKSIGRLVDEDEMIRLLIDGINKDLSVTCQILETKENLDFDDAVASLMHAEAKLGVKVPPAVFHFVKGHKGHKQGKCHFCGKPGHWKRECRLFAASLKGKPPDAEVNIVI